MPTFASETDVRLVLQANDTAAVPAALVAASIAEAHDSVVRRIASETDTGTPPAALVRGEALLAGAHVLRSLAAKDAIEQRHVAIGTQRIEAGARYTALIAVAERLESRAWDLLAPYLAPCPARACANATDPQ